MENDSLFRQDPELYDMSVETRQAMTYGKTDDEIGMPDIDAEWDALSTRARQRSSRRAVLRIAAVFIGLVMMTGLPWGLSTCSIRSATKATRTVPPSNTGSTASTTFNYTCAAPAPSSRSIQCATTR